MAEILNHAPGSFCWLELASTNADAGLKFYTELFGWSVNSHDMGEMGKYHILQKGGQDVAALYQMMPEMQAAGVPTNWLSYVAVTSADEAVEQTKSLGGTVVNGPFDVYDMGRMAVLTDPQGAVFAVWQAMTHHGVQRRDEDDTLCWNELQARDIEGSRVFYTSLFPWTFKGGAEYTEWHLTTGEAIGGMLPVQSPDMPPHWLPYFSVADCEATVRKAQELGAALYAPPMDIEGVGRFAVVADPQGGAFAVIKLELGAH
jgi:predicted enzyme related to lactoylglutathione lyase